MSNRSTVANTHTHDKKVVKLTATVAVGGTGAPTLQKFVGPGNSMALAAAAAAGFNGIKSISRTSAGLYVLKLQDKYQRLLSFRVEFLVDAIPAAPIAHAKATGTDVKSATSPQVTFVCHQTSDGAATDPASGEIMLITLELLDTTAL